jgi:hypothetical protein
MFNFPSDVFAFDMDSIPGKIYFRSTDDDEWKAFSKDFEARFKEQFGDFYKKNEKEFEKMMKEMEDNFADRYVEQELSHKQLRESMLAREEMMQATQEAHHAREEAMRHMRESQGVQVAARSVDVEAMAEAERAMQARSAEMHERSAHLHEAGNNMKAFERSLRAMLIEDGYIKSTDEVKSFKREQSGAMEVNGKKIREADLERYNTLHKKHFKSGFHYWNVE